MPWAAVAGAVITSYSAQKQQDKAKKDTQDLSREGFQRQAWLDQQQRKWNLEDRKYVEDSIGEFKGFAPESATTFNGQQFQSPAPTNTGGLANFDPNTPGALATQDDPNYMKPKPLMMSGG